MSQNVDSMFFMVDRVDIDDPPFTRDLGHGFLVTNDEIEDNSGEGMEAGFIGTGADIGELIECCCRNYGVGRRTAELIAAQFRVTLLEIK